MLPVVPKGREHSTPPGLPRKAPGSVGRETKRENSGQEPLFWLPWEGMGEAGRAGLGLADLNQFSGLWGLGRSLVAQRVRAT